MAGNGYYRESFLDSYTSPTREIRHSTPVKQTSRVSYSPFPPPNSPHRSLSPDPFYQHTDHNPHYDESRYKKSQPFEQSQEEDEEDHEGKMIPLKPSNRIRTSMQEVPNDTAADDLMSPESQKELPLVPEPTPVKSGFFSRVPWVVYIVSLAQITVFIGEIIENSMVTGSPIMIHPQFNPMIGPSTYVLINMGARFVPCMKVIPGVQDSSIPISWPCPNTTTSDPTAASNHCDLSALCGSAYLTDAHPNQWFRFIVPMFLHAGIVHIGFNMILQLTMGREMELAIGSVRFALVYFSSGIFGFVLGGNFAATAIASTGASGCLFGILALTLLDLIYCWNERPKPVRELMWILCDVLVSFVLGLLPGLDNFSHIGGFLMGLVLGICILHSPNVLRRRSGEKAPYQSMGSNGYQSRPPTAMATVADVTAFAKEPVGFFKHRKPAWWAWWLIRASALFGVLAAFVVLIHNFYNNHNTCSWCKYLSCLPINHWCSIGNLQLTNYTTGNKRELLRSSPVALLTDLADFFD